MNSSTFTTCTSVLAVAGLALARVAGAEPVPLVHFERPPGVTTSDQFGKFVLAFDNDLIISAPQTANSQPPGNLGRAYRFNAAGQMLMTYESGNQGTGFGNGMAQVGSHLVVIETGGYRQVNQFFIPFGLGHIFDAQTGAHLNTLNRSNLSPPNFNTLSGAVAAIGDVCAVADSGANMSDLWNGQTGQFIQRLPFAGIIIAGNVITLGSRFVFQNTPTAALPAQSLVFVSAGGTTLQTIPDPQPNPGVIQGSNFGGTMAGSADGQRLLVGAKGFAQLPNQCSSGRPTSTTGAACSCTRLRRPPSAASSATPSRSSATTS